MLVGIRSITYTISWNDIKTKSYQSKLTETLWTLKSTFIENHFSIRTLRFNIVALNALLVESPDSILNQIDGISKFCEETGFRWFNIAFDLSALDSDQIKKACEYGYLILQTYENAFVNFVFPQKIIDFKAFKHVASLIKKTSTITHNGITNFRLGASFNTRPNTPFFPFSYSDSEDSFSLAIETVELTEALMKKHMCSDYSNLKESVINGLTMAVQKVDGIAHSIQSSQGIKYNGMDISFAPYPEDNISVVSLLKALGAKDFGGQGTQFFTSFLTSILKETITRSKIKSVGFNGVMYSLLEDKLMCESYQNGHFTLDSLLLYSTVCGCGLDMLPLPGDIDDEELAAMMLDVAATAERLNKPLGFRGLPIPNKGVGEKTALELDFLTNAEIIENKNILFKNELFELNQLIL